MISMPIDEAQVTLHAAMEWLWKQLVGDGAHFLGVDRQVGRARCRSGWSMVDRDTDIHE